MIGLVIIGILGALIVGVGVAQWVGLYRRWYVVSTDTGRWLLRLTGVSPLKWIFAGLAPLAIVGGYLFVLAGAGSFVLLIALVCCLSSVFLALLFLFWCPPWAVPPWLRGHQ